MFSFGHCPNEGGGRTLPELKKHTICIYFWRPKKMYKLPEMGEGGGGEEIRAMPKRKHSFFKEVFPKGNEAISGGWESLKLFWNWSSLSHRTMLSNHLLKSNLSQNVILKTFPNCPFFVKRYQTCFQSTGCSRKNDKSKMFVKILIFTKIKFFQLF